MAGHDRLDATMFWTGALLAFTPVIIGLVVVGVIVYNRRKLSAERGGSHDGG
jgi:hypothetical protein